MLDLNVISTWAALVTALIALGAWITQSRSTTFSIKIQNQQFKESIYDSEEMIRIRKKASKDILNKKFNTNEVTILFNFFESVGLLLRRNALDLEMLWNDFSSPTLYYWSASETYLINVRNSDETIWENYEYLFKKLMWYSKKKYKLKDYDISAKEINQFLRREARTTKNSFRKRKIMKNELDDSSKEIAG